MIIQLTLGYVLIILAVGFLYGGLSKLFGLLVDLAAKIEPNPKHSDQFATAAGQAESAAILISFGIGAVLLLFHTILTFLTYPFPNS